MDRFAQLAVSLQKQDMYGKVGAKIKLAKNIQFFPIVLKTDPGVHKVGTFG